VQRVDAFPFDDALFCGREGAGHLLLCAKTGHTIEKPREVKAVYPSPFSKHLLVSARTLDLHLPFGTRLGKIERTTFAELDCCFSDSEILITESGGAVRCFNLSPLALLWTHTPKAGSHFLNLCFSQSLSCFVGVRWHYKDSTNPGKHIIHLDPRSGTVLKELPVGTPGYHEFCLAGSHVFTSNFHLFNVETGKVMRGFGHPKTDDHAA
jgi:outer membrane protein assembly factor BamB